MQKLIVFCAVLVVSVYGGGEFTVLHHPPSITLKGHDHIKESTLIEVLAASLGFSTERYSTFRGIFIEDPFNLAEAICTVSVDGVHSTGLQKGHHFPLKTDEDDSIIYSSLEIRVNERYPQSGPNLVHIDLSNGLEDFQTTIFKSIKSDKPKKTAYNNLKIDIDEDREFLQEVGLLNAVCDRVEKGLLTKDFVPDVFWFKVSSLHAVSDLHGENSTATKEAKTVLNEAILCLNSAFSKAYNGNVFFNVITSDASHTRRSRSILEAKDTPSNDTDTHNLAKNYNKNYPVIFNIILWFGVVMFFALLAISLAIGNMDPGRDSIIYRMTSTRMKKDN